MFKKTAAAVSLSCVLGIAGSAQADTFLFNPAGTGATGAVAVTSIDWLQGNTLAVGGGGPIVVGNIINDLYQANLDSLVNGSTPVFTNGDNGLFITVVSSFSEQVTFTSGFGTAGGVATFDNTAATSGLPSFFRVCAQTVLGNDLTGAGFACTDANAILTGTLTDIIGAVAATDFSNVQTLDQFNGDDWSNQQTVSSTGGANILVTVNFANAGYFPGLTAGSTLVTSLTNTSFIDPFDQQNPSYCFSSNGVTSNTDTRVCNNGSFQAFGTLGAVNGLSGPNFIFQSDANTSLRLASVPEPGTLALLGLALTLIPVVSRSRKTRM